MADRVLEDLLISCSFEKEEILRKAAQVLQNWDRKAETDSIGAVLFLEWLKEMKFDLQPEDAGIEAWFCRYCSLFAIPVDFKNPSDTPSGISDLVGAKNCLRRAAETVLRDYGNLSIP